MYIFFILAIFFLNRKKIKRSVSSKYVIGLYCMSLFLGFVLEILSVSNTDSWDFINLGLILVSLHISFRALNKYDLLKSSLQNDKLLLDKFSIRLIVFLSIISTLLYSFDFISFITTANLGEARLEHQLGEGVSRGFIYSFFATISFSYHLNIYVFFDTVIKGKVKLALLPLLGSFSYVFWVSSVFGRDGLVFWILSFLFFYFIFYKVLNRRLKRFFTRSFVVLGTVFFIFFIKVSSSRFSDHSLYVDKSVNPVFLSFIDYAGQQLKNAHDYYEMDISHTNGIYNFSFIYRQIYGAAKVKKDMEMVQWEISRKGKKHFYFAFFLKELWVDFGRYGTLLVVGFFIFFISLSLSNKNSIKSKFIIYITYSQFLLMGLFYNKFYLPAANAYLLFIVIIVLIENLINGKQAKSISSRHHLR